MKLHILLLAGVLLSACGGGDKAKYEACAASDVAAWDSSDLNYAGGNKGPGRDGMGPFNNVLSQDTDLRQSEFEIVYKTNGKANTQCVTKQLTCTEAGESYCQEFNCTVDLKAPALVRVIDAQNTYYFKTDKPTSLNWDGKKLGCKAP